MELGAHVGGDGAGEGGWRAWPASEEAPSFSSRIAPVSGGASSVELVALVLVCTACVCMQAFTARRGATRHGATAAEHASFQRLRRRYNAVYVLGTFGDWIQGAYLYALYREHGFGMADIGYIFVLGYASSASLGTYVASLGDAHGHRRFVVAYGVIYGAACFASRSSRLSTLLAARVASGVAYSLLFSSFESWAICEIDRLALDRRYLVPLFSTATFFNAVSAVAAGVAGNLAVDVEWGARMRDPPGKTRAAFVLPRGRLGDDEPSVASSGLFARDAVRTMKLKLERGASLGNKYSPAFDVGAVALLACAACARAWWADARASGAGTPGAAGDDDARGGGGGGGGGVGDDRGLELGAMGGSSSSGRANEVGAGASAGTGDGEGGERGGEGSGGALGVWRAAKLALADPDLLSLGTINSLYEAALHVFVFVWTPALERRRALGASEGSDPGAVPHGVVFSLFMACKMAGSQAYALVGERAPARATLECVFLLGGVAFLTPLATEAYGVTLFAFCAFEFGLGLYWPAMAVARAELVPNALRATMTSVFRVPLNALVVACLAFAGNASEPAFLAMCAGMMTACLAFTSRAKGRTRKF